MQQACPCCHAAPGQVLGIGDSHFRCTLCAHVWRTESLPRPHYEQSAGRNAGAAGLARKYADRLATIAPLLRDGLRILEIGCADGEFGVLVKKQAAVEYIGIEISRDADSAAQRLDRVHRHPAALVDEAPFDLLLAFHVLEHIPDINGEIVHWRRLMTHDAWLILEVPHEAGHRLLNLDRHKEHIHQFSASSLALVLKNAGFTIRQLSTGHFESVVYSDSLRVLARPSLSPDDKTRRLLARFHAVFPDRMVIYGLGGDFENYVAPLLPDLPVAALCDSNSDRWGSAIGSHRISAYDPASQKGLPVLITTNRHAPEIAASLMARGVPSENIFPLSRIMDDDNHPEPPTAS